MILQRWMHAIIHFYKPIDCTTPRVNTNLNYGLWMIMMRQYKFINYNKCTTLVADVDNGGRRGCVCVGTGSIWQISVPSSQFCWEPKISL